MDLNEIAKFRAKEFVPQESPLLDFYRRTAEDYEKRKIETEQAMEPIESLWEDRYKRFEQARLDSYREELRRRGAKYDAAKIQSATSMEELDALVGNKSLRPSETSIRIAAYSEPFLGEAKKKNRGRYISYSDLFSKTGERKDLNEIVRENTSKYTGKPWWYGEEADKLLKSRFDFTEAEENLKNYSSKAEMEQARLAKANEEASRAFYEQKNKTLNAMASSAYRGATYTEKPR
jgi:hypothetical protein